MQMESASASTLSMVVPSTIESTLPGGTIEHDSMECGDNVEAMLVELEACARATQDLLHRLSQLMRHNGDVRIALSICVNSVHRWLAGWWLAGNFSLRTLA